MNTEIFIRIKDTFKLVIDLNIDWVKPLTYSSIKISKITHTFSMFLKDGAEILNLNYINMSSPVYNGHFLK